MTDQIGTVSTPNATWGTYYNNFGTIQTMDFNLEGSAEPFPLYGLGRDETMVDDFGGVTFSVTLTIRKVDTTANIATFITALLTLINGDQTPSNNYPFIFISDYIGTIYVKVTDITGHVISGNVTTLEYTIKLVQAAQGV